MNVLQESIVEYLFKEKTGGNEDWEKKLEEIDKDVLYGKRLLTLSEVKDKQHAEVLDKYIQAVMERTVLDSSLVITISQITEQEYQNFIISELGLNKWKPLRSKLEVNAYLTYIRNISSTVSKAEVPGDLDIDYTNITPKTLPTFNKNQIDFLLEFIGYHRLVGENLFATIESYIRTDLKDLVEEMKIKNNELLETKTLTVNDLKHIKVISPQVKEEHVKDLGVFLVKKAREYMNI